MPVDTRSTTFTSSSEEMFDYLDKKFEELKTNFVEEIKHELKNEIKSLLKQHEEKIEKLESTVSVLQQHVQQVEAVPVKKSSRVSFFSELYLLFSKKQFQSIWKNNYNKLQNTTERGDLLCCFAWPFTNI